MTTRAKLLRKRSDAPGPPRVVMIAERVFEHLSDSIINGDLPPGAKISEPKLARQLGVSRSPLREVIRRLEGRKLVVSHPNLGAKVVVPTRAALLELFTVRAALEGLAAREAARRITPEEIGKLREMLDEHAGFLGGSGAAVYFQEKANIDFHFFLAQASRNRLLINLLCDEYYPLLRFYRMHHKFVQGRAHRAFDEHLQIADAVEHHEADVAELLMRRHIDRARASIEDALPEEPDAQKRNGRRRVRRTWRVTQQGRSQW